MKNKSGFKCEECGKVLSTLRGFRGHRTRVHFKSRQKEPEKKEYLRVETTQAFVDAEGLADFFSRVSVLLLGLAETFQYAGRRLKGEREGE